MMWIHGSEVQEMFSFSAVFSRRDSHLVVKHHTRIVAMEIANAVSSYLLLGLASSTFCSNDFVGRMMAIAVGPSQKGMLE
jgi:hypothetical protein